MIYHNIVLGNDNAEIGSAEYRAPKRGYSLCDMYFHCCFLLSYIFILWSTVEVFSRDFRLGIIRFTRIDSGSFCVSCIRIMYVVTPQLFLYL